MGIAGFVGKPLNSCVDELQKPDSDRSGIGNNAENRAGRATKKDRKSNKKQDRKSNKNRGFRLAESPVMLAVTL